MYVLGADLIVKETKVGFGAGDKWYLEIEPGLFQEAQGPRRAVFREDEKGRITHLLIDLAAYERLPWYETSALHQALFDNWGFVWAAMIVLWLVTLLVRRLLRKPALDPLLRNAHWLLAGVGVLNIGFLLSLDGAFWMSQTIMKAMLILPLMSLALTLGAVATVGMLWLRKGASVLEQIYVTLAVLQAVLFLVFLNHWNLVGFRFG